MRRDDAAGEGPADLRSSTQESRSGKKDEPHSSSASEARTAVLAPFRAARSAFRDAEIAETDRTVELKLRVIRQILECNPGVVRKLAALPIAPGLEHHPGQGTGRESLP
jgi:hypothetical protein